MNLRENQIEQSLIAKLTDLKYTYRPDIGNRETLEQNFRNKFEALNRVHLTDAEFARLRDGCITADVFTAAKTLRERNTFIREDGTPLHYELVKLNASAEFINHFKEVQRLKTQLDQYTDLGEDLQAGVAELLPENTLRAFKGMYLDTAQRLKAQQKDSGNDNSVQQLDFEFVLLASAVIDYDYIMGLIAKSTQATDKQKMTRSQLIDLISSSANLMDERDDIIAYINSGKCHDRCRHILKTLCGFVTT